MRPTLHDDFGIRSTYSAAQNDAGFVRLLDFIARNPHCEIEAHGKEFDRDGPVSVSISQEIVFHNPVKLVAGGGGFLHTVSPGLRDYGFALNWAGSAGATMLKVATAPNARKLHGFVLRGLALYGNDVAARALDMRSLSGFDIQVSANGLTEVAIHAGVVDYATPERADLVAGRLEAEIAQVGAASGKCFMATGTEDVNVCKNTFIFPHICHKNAPAFDLVNTDSNTWEDVTIANWGDNSKPGIIFRAGPTNAQRSRGEVFEFLECGGGGVTVEGTDVAPCASTDHEGPWRYENFPDLPAFLRIGPGATFDVTNLRASFAAFKTSGSYSAWTPTPIEAWGQSFNHGGCFNAATGVFKAPVTGVYELSLQLFHSNTITPGSRWELSLKRSGAGSNRAASYYAQAATYDCARVSGRMALLQGETVTPQIRCVGVGGVFEIVPDASVTRFEGGIVR